MNSAFDYTNRKPTPASGWYLEGFQDGKPWIIRIKSFPFAIGRLEGSDLFLSSSEISRRHAEIDANEQGIIVRDFNSTNGTFINNRRLQGAQPIKDGDILHFGRFEFRLRHEERLPQTDELEDDLGVTRFSAAAPQESFFATSNRFEEMLRTRAVQPHFQPLVSAKDRRLIGYELLGRGKLEGLVQSPAGLLEIARALGKEKECSTLFRETGIAMARILSQTKLQIFFNILPEETELNFLRTAVPKLREIAPDLPLAMEIHEKTVTQVTAMAEIKALLHDHQILLAYDDFGAGESRLLEAIKVPPDVLKFDIALIRNIDREPETQQGVADLVTFAHNRGIKTLAEGTETQAEVETCVALGFDYLQGFYFGKPAPDFGSTVFRVAQ